MIIINYFHRFFAQLDSIAFGVKNRCTNCDRERWMCRFGKVFSKNLLKNFRQCLIFIVKKIIIALPDFVRFFPIGNFNWRSWSVNSRKIDIAEISKKGIPDFCCQSTSRRPELFHYLKEIFECLTNLQRYTNTKNKYSLHYSYFFHRTKANSFYQKMKNTPHGSPLNTLLLPPLARSYLHTPAYRKPSLPPLWLYPKEK